MWARLVTALLGLWLMASPAALGFAGAAATVVRIVGPLTVATGIIAAWEVTRPLRWVAAPLGLSLLVAPFALRSGFTVASLNSAGAGALLLALAPLGGDVQARFGGGWSALWKPVAADPEPGETTMTPHT